MKMTILHLTDLHVNKRIAYFEDKIKSLVNILNNDDFSNTIIIVFSGDLSFSGEEEQFIIVSDFLKEIVEKVSKNGKKVYVAACPGNHDRCFKDKDIDSDVISALNADNYLSYLNDYSYLMDNYERFVNKLDYHRKINEIIDCFEFTIGEKRVKIFSLNNAHLTEYTRQKNNGVDSNYENIFIPADLLKIDRKNEEYAFLLTHMPLRYLSSKTRNTLNAICSDNIDIVFDGHVHDESITIKNDGYVELTSSALYSDDLSGMTLLHLNDNQVQPFVYVFDTSDSFKKYRRDNRNINSFDFKMKINTTDGFSVNKEAIDNNTSIKINDNTIINVDNIFVFPTLSESRYKLTSEKRHISSFGQFKEITKNRQIVNITGDEDSGKTTLARQLFYSYIRDGKSPVLFDGKTFGSDRTNKSVKDRIIFQLRDNYLNRNIDLDYFESQVDNRVLILDNYDLASEFSFVDCLAYFNQVIIFSDTDNDRNFEVNNFDGLQYINFNIEPLFRNKREEMCKNIYAVISESNPHVKDNLTVDKYIQMVEKMIDKMDVSYMTSPSFLLDLSIKILLNIEIYTSGRNLAYQKEHYNYLIDKGIVEHRLETCTSKMVDRLLADVAYNAYKNMCNNIEKDVFENALINEMEEYDSTPFIDVDHFIDFLIELKFIKESSNKSSCYQFANLKIFSFYVGKYAMIKHNEQDEDAFKLIISRGIYSKLNFNILMSVAYCYDIENIPNYFVTDLYDEVCVNYIPCIHDLNGIKTYFLKEKKRISDIDEKEKAEIRERISDGERESREEYIENIDNYFYEKTVNDDLRELIELSNKNQIVASLLNSSDLLKGAQKKKLMQIAITLPNIIVDKYIGHVQKHLDVFYIKILDELEKENDEEKSRVLLSEVDSFFDYLISIVTAMILAFYDEGSRPLSNPIMNEKLQEALQNNNNDLFKMPAVQRLMLMSFSNKEETFIKEITKYLDEEKDSYNKHAASLIARRYCIDNFDSLQKNKRAFLNKIQGIFGKSIIIDANKNRAK